MHMPCEVPPIPKCFSHLLPPEHQCNFDQQEHHDHHSTFVHHEDVSSASVHKNDLKIISSNLVPIESTSHHVHPKESWSLPTTLDRHHHILKFQRDSGCELDGGEQGCSAEGENVSCNRLESLESEFLNKSPHLEGGDSLQEHSPCLVKSSDSERLKELATQSLPTDFSSAAGTKSSPFSKLNFSLSKLMKEMKDLRFMDISIFYQLNSLHEAIQDYKLSMSDRYSETGSEYSLGTASYMGSMSSLNEESDFFDEGDGTNRLEADPECASASSLLQQITNLALRAEKDFED